MWKVVNQHNMHTASPIAQIAGALFQAIEERRMDNSYYDKLKIPGTPKGKQLLGDAPAIGSRVKMLSTATRKEGLTARVDDRYKMNGFVYVVTDSCGTQRVQDVEVIK
jgi:hypothetical protein